MRFRFLGLPLAGLAAVAAPTTHEGLKIVTRETFPAGTHDTITYVAGDRARLESRMSSSTRDGGTQRAESIVVRRCDLDTIFLLHPAERTYQARPLQMKLNGLERFTISLSRRQEDPPAPATLVVETTTVDTGERKTAFGHTARRVVTTRKDIPVGKTTAPPETVTDGWYIDLETRTTCEREPAGRAVLVATVSPAADARAKPASVTFKDVGKPEKGFAIESKTTWRSSADEPRPQRSSVFMHSEVTELSPQQFDAKMFDVPDGYHSSDGILTSFAARWGRTARIVQAAVASWFR